MKSVKRNYIYQVMYELLAIIIPLITAPYVTRVLGAANLGVFSYTQSVANLFLSLARLGVVNHGSRSIASVQEDREKRSKVFSQIYIIQFTFSLLITISYILCILLFVKENILIALIQTIWVAVSIVDIAWVFAGIENFKLTVVKGISVKIVTLVLIFLFVKNDQDLWKYAIIVTGGMFLGNLILWRSFHKYFDFVKPELSEACKQIKPMVVLFIPTIAVTIYTMMDKIMLGNISGDIYVAYYEYSSKLVVIPMGFITSFGAVMLPRMSAMNAGGVKQEEQITTIKLSLYFVMFLACAFSFGLASISSTLIPLYYGAGFVSCVLLMQIVAIKLPAMAWANVIRTQMLIPRHKDKQYIISLFVGAFANLILNVILIKHYNAVGAAIATVVAEIIVCIVQTMCIKGKKVFAKPLLMSFVFVLDGLLMYAVVSNIPNVITLPAFYLLVLQIICGVIVYCSVGFVCIAKFIVEKSVFDTFSLLKNSILKI